MNKTIAVVLGVIVLAVGVYFFMSTPAAGPVVEDGTVSDTSGEEETSVRSSGEGTFAEVLALGENITCDFTYTDPETGGETEGTVFVAGERVRGDFAMTQEGEEYSFNTIQDGEYGYTWGSGPMGAMAMKFALQKDDTVASTEESSQDPFETDARVTYECDRWSVDESKFVPPADVEFQDFTEATMQIDASTDMKAAQCAACEQVPAESRAQCLAALGC